MCREKWLRAGRRGYLIYERLPGICGGYSVNNIFNMDESGEKKPKVIGKSAKPRCFKNNDKKTQPVHYYNSKTAWMTSYMFEDWVRKLTGSLAVTTAKFPCFWTTPPDRGLQDTCCWKNPMNTPSERAGVGNLDPRLGFSGGMGRAKETDQGFTGRNIDNTQASQPGLTQVWQR
ncbi:hypothetical protein Bbelb_019220 [Branchiostoma belcheri]|nr:hypothetical protein Bbelb_019220 [Branchiostoma belcheri]